MTKPSLLNVRFAKWVILLSQYECSFYHRKLQRVKRWQIFWPNI